MDDHLMGYYFMDVFGDDYFVDVYFVDYFIDDYLMNGNFLKIIRSIIIWCVSHFVTSES